MRTVVRIVFGGEIMVNSKKDKPGKRQYQKPVVMRFPLKPEEAVLGFCKSSGSNGTNFANCFDPILNSICQFPGS